MKSLPIYVRVTVDGKRAEWSVQRSCNQGTWNQAMGRASGTKEEVKILNAYLDVSGLRYSEPSSPLFRMAVRRTKRLTQNRMTAHDMARMVKRRLREAGLSIRLA